MESLLTLPTLLFTWFFILGKGWVQGLSKQLQLLRGQKLIHRLEQV